MHPSVQTHHGTYGLAMMVMGSAAWPAWLEFMISARPLPEPVSLVTTLDLFMLRSSLQLVPEPLLYP